MRYRELPGQSWVGWSFTRGQLVTPEGHSISGHDSAWWSLLVRRSHGFTELYQRQKFDKLAELHTVDLRSPAHGREAAMPPAAGLVPFKTTLETSLLSWGQYGAIIGPWPTISDFPPLSMPMLENVVNASESALTPCSVSPSMPTCGNPSSQHPEVSQPDQGLLLPLTGTQAVQTSTPAIPGLRLMPVTARLQLVNPPSPPKPKDAKSPGNSEKPANSDGFEVAKVAA